MRPDARIDGTVPAFTLSCPGYRGPGTRRRNDETSPKLIFSIGTEVLAEIAHEDLVESWEAACDLTAGEAASMAEVAASHLSELIDSGLKSADLTDAVTDAAVVFLLAMRRQGYCGPERIPPCTVMWDGQEGCERVFLAV